MSQGPQRIFSPLPSDAEFVRASQIELGLAHLAQAHRLERRAKWGPRRFFASCLTAAAEERSAARALFAQAHGKDWK